MPTATPAQLQDLILAAGKAAGLLQGLEQIRPDLAAKIAPVRAELSRAAWAAMGRPAHSSAGNAISLHERILQMDEACQMASAAINKAKGS